MKCPKCGYTSFDHNDHCPRCLKDIASERHRLNLPAFTPNPPHLLGPLSGEVGAKIIGFETEKMAPALTLSAAAFGGPEDSQALQAMEMAFETDQEAQGSIESRAEQTDDGLSEFESFHDLELESDLEGIALTDLSLDDLEPPSSLTVDDVTPEEAAIDLSSDASSSVGDERVDLDDELLFGVEEGALEESLGQISDHASSVLFLDDEAAMEEEQGGPLDLNQLASMVESINADVGPAEGGRSFNPSLGIEHMMDDEIPGPEVTLGARSDQEDPTQRGSDPQQRLRTKTTP
jgi:hypothetical protein